MITIGAKNLRFQRKEVLIKVRAFLIDGITKVNECGMC